MVALKDLPKQTQHAIARVRSGLTEGRCSDFDDDCQDVSCHVSCWLGGRQEHNGQVYDTPTADGYCPFLQDNVKEPKA